MEEAEYELVLRQSYTILMMSNFLLEKLPSAIRLAEKSESVGWVMDPTLWRDKHQQLDQDIQVMKAVLSLAKLYPQPEKQPAIKESPVQEFWEDRK